MTYKVTTSSGQEYTTESKSGDSALWEAKRGIRSRNPI